MISIDSKPKIVNMINILTIGWGIGCIIVLLSVQIHAKHYDKFRA